MPVTDVQLVAKTLKQRVRLACICEPDGKFADLFFRTMAKRCAQRFADKLRAQTNATTVIPFMARPMSAISACASNHGHSLSVVAGDCGPPMIISKSVLWRSSVKDRPDELCCSSDYSRDFFPIFHKRRRFEMFMNNKMDVHCVSLWLRVQAAS